MHVYNKIKRRAGCFPEKKSPAGGLAHPCTLRVDSRSRPSLCHLTPPPLVCCRNVPKPSTSLFLHLVDSRLALVLYLYQIVLRWGGGALEQAAAGPSEISATVQHGRECPRFVFRVAPLRCCGASERSPSPIWLSLCHSRTIAHVTDGL